ncbi:hypothetical protein AURDEDRAFT_110551 [Auricularia subglabra TFB-10046 SS5]|nr:hypothetical protein AURDEDRAFT_110551 [Auricularia subglabra TFB-10046 SS5]
MSSTRFNVQLSASTDSFQVSVPSDSTVAQLKDQITETCPGRPTRAGQRVIYKGRIINDSEVVGDIWNTGEQEYTIHVAVNPSAWTSQPPKVQPQPQPEPSASTSRPPTPHAPSPAQSPAATTHFVHTAQPAYVPPSPPYAMAMIHHLHINALRTLCRLPPVPWWGFVTQDMASARAFCKSTIEAAGGAWPAIFDQEYPAAQPGEGDGVQYSVAFSNSLPYLILQTPDATPTAAQRHALRVLEATLPLLNQTPLIQAQFLQQVHQTLQTHALVTARAAVHHNLPRAGVRIGPLGGAIQPLAQIQFRVLVAPLLMLAFRASLLLYIFSPSRRPLFAILIAGWVAWEVFAAFRAAMGPPPGAAARAAAAAAAARPAAGAAVNNGPGGAPGGPAQPQANGVAPGTPDATLLGLNRDQDMIARLANIDLAAEAAILAPGAGPTPPPPLSLRVKSFFTLLVLSMHPAWWNRRRRALRNREGQLRTLYRQVDPNEQPPTEQTPGGEQQQREPPPQPPAGWAASYVERVRNTEWVDE